MKIKRSIKSSNYEWNYEDIPEDISRNVDPDGYIDTIGASITANCMSRAAEMGYTLKDLVDTYRDETGEEPMSDDQGVMRRFRRWCDEYVGEDEPIASSIDWDEDDLNYTDIPEDVSTLVDPDGYIDEITASEAPYYCYKDGPTYNPVGIREDGTYGDLSPNYDEDDPDYDSSPLDDDEIYGAYEDDNMEMCKRCGIAYVSPGVFYCDECESTMSPEEREYFDATSIDVYDKDIYNDDYDDDYETRDDSSYYGDAEDQYTRIMEDYDDEGYNYYDDYGLVTM